MLTCVQTQFKGFLREIEQEVKQHEARTLNKSSSVNARLKKSVAFFLFLFLQKNLYIILFPSC